MTPLRSLVLASALLLACNQDQAAPGDASGKDAAAAASAAQAKPPGSMPPNVLPPSDPHAAAVAAADEAPQVPLAPSAAGTFDATIDGTLTHFTRLPPAQNRAVSLPDEGVQRVSIGAYERDPTGPSIRLLIDGLRPDQVQYPLTIPAKAERTKDGPSLSVRYVVHDKRVYVINPDKGAEVTLTLEGYEGSTLRGRFEGKLAPTAAGLGDPIAVSGKFAVALGLRGVEPGPEAAAAPPAAGGDDAKAPAP